MLRGLFINQTGHTWALNTTYIPMTKGFAHLVAVIDWASRKVLAAKIAITPEACHAADVLQEAFNHHGMPGIVDTDQGCQYTADEFVKAITDQGCRLSMDDCLAGQCYY